MGMELTRDPASRGLTEEDIVHIPGMASRWVRLADGAKAHYVVSGDTGPSIILLHGGIVGSSGTAGWRFMAPFLGANGFRVYCPDRPGFGWADTRPEYRPMWGYKSMVDFVHMFANALCLDKFHLAGNSMGGQITVQYVIHHPDRIISFALIGTNIGDIVQKPRVTGKESKWSPNPDFAAPVWDGTEASMRTLMEGIIFNTPEIWPELITMRNKAAERQRGSFVPGGLGAGRPQGSGPPPAIGGGPDIPAYHQWAHTKDHLDNLGIPAVYLYGLQDVLGPVENAFNQEDVLPANIQMFYPDQCGHQGQTDQPAMFNQAFLEFFRDGKVSWKTAEWAGVSRRRQINPDLVEEPADGFPAPDPGRYESPEAFQAALAVAAPAR